jgi:hypothetical protein
MNVAQPGLLRQKVVERRRFVSIKIDGKPHD